MRRCYVLLVLVALALIAAACGGDEQAERRRVAEIEPALIAEGLVLARRPTWSVSCAAEAGG